MKKVCALLLLILPGLAAAKYNANIRGQVESVLTYSTGDVIIILKNQPDSHPMCDHRYFYIDASDMSEGAVSRMLSRALMAYATHEDLNIGYDDGTDPSSACSNGSIRVHRVG